MDSRTCPLLFLAPNSNSKSKSNVSNPNVIPSLMSVGIQSCNGYPIHRRVACSHMDNWLLHGRVAHTWTIASHIDEWLTHGRRLAYTSTNQWRTAKEIPSPAEVMDGGPLTCPLAFCFYDTLTTNGTLVFLFFSQIYFTTL